MSKHETAKQRPSLMRTNKSGYRGVSWHKSARKWDARIRRDGVLLYLGLFDTAEKASAAYNRVAANLDGDQRRFDPIAERRNLLSTVRGLYAMHGIKALSTLFLDKQRGKLYAHLLAADLNQTVLLATLGLTEEYATWRDANRTYRGVTKPKWTWDVAVTKAAALARRDGDLPSVPWCYKNGLSSLVSTVHKAGKTWEDLRIAVGLKPSARFSQSRNGMRWRSHPEACLSNFLYARGIEHKRGGRYPDSFAIETGRHWATYDLHFRTPDGQWIDVEVWGDGLNGLSGERYQVSRKLKEGWHRDRSDFLGIPYLHCFSDARMAEHLKPHIGVIAPFVFDKPSDRAIETSLWSDTDELFDECRRMAACMPDGVFPCEDWLRKRGKYKNRPGVLYNTLAAYVNSKLGGTRKLRAALGHGHASTTEWSPDKLIAQWQEFETKHGVTPSQCKGKSAKQYGLSAAILAEGSKIYEAARRHGVVDAARGGKTARKIIWTPEHTLDEWWDFTFRNRRSPSECMSRFRRATLPRDVTDEATRIYDAARRLGILEEARRAEFAAPGIWDDTSPQ
jgi:hypothetical protein